MDSTRKALLMALIWSVIVNVFAATQSVHQWWGSAPASHVGMCGQEVVVGPFRDRGRWYIVCSWVDVQGLSQTFVARTRFDGTWDVLR